uniref:Peptidase A1 domain-containing protein n=1 Tax=Compsopogon caeruleus TaxID=31354 RepID=A0A7S1XDZ2_9RHOD|mmetsp:Transcript_39/g.61  ORF Transcript_39/g.61 Transcript_39/m.61 type:complete len:474 (+) Transcript_39:74-1495(+)
MKFPRVRMLFVWVVAMVGLCWSAVCTAENGQSVVVPLGCQAPHPMRGKSTRGFPETVRVIHRTTGGFWSRVRVWIGLGDNHASIERVGVVSELKGGITALGLYYLTAKFGGQSMNLLVDTGSAVTAVPMQQCQTGCPSGGNRYSRENSTSGVAHAVSCLSTRCKTQTCQSSTCGACSAAGQCCAGGSTKSCGFQLSYLDGSFAQGALQVDTVELAPGVGTKTVFGGILAESENFGNPPVDGILGLAYKGISCSPSCVPPVFDSYVKRGVVGKDTFTICMEESSGALILGDYNSSLGNSPIQWTPEIPVSGEKTFYLVDLGGGIDIGSERIPLPDFKVGVLDTGTTLIIMTDAAFQALASYLREYNCEIPFLCQNPTWFAPVSCIALSDSELERLPVLTFSLGSVKVDVSPFDYMIKYTYQGVLYRCVGIQTFPSLGSIDVILGEAFMQSHVIVHDREQNRIGIQKRTRSCSSY